VDERLPDPTRPRQAGARFRCLPCRRFVEAGPSGVCPHCGYAPPTLVPPVAEPGPSRLYWALMVLFCAIVAVIAALWVVRI
jgi:hypothetical protein